jgi:hypothetical protein
MHLRLQPVVLQGAAAMLLSGRKHCHFNLPVFQCPAFEDFLNLIKIHQNSMLNPSDVTLEQILPGVCNQFSNLHSDMSLHFAQIHESVSGLVKPADLQGFLIMFLDTTSIGCLKLQKMLLLLPLLKLDQMLMYHNMNFVNHTGQLLLCGMSGLTHTTLVHPTMLNVFLVVLMNRNESTKINGRIIFLSHRQNHSLESNQLWQISHTSLIVHVKVHLLFWQILMPICWKTIFPV